MGVYLADTGRVFNTWFWADRKPSILQICRHPERDGRPLSRPCVVDKSSSSLEVPDPKIQRDPSRLS